MSLRDYLETRLTVLKQQARADTGPVDQASIARAGAIAELEHVLAAAYTFDA